MKKIYHLATCDNNKRILRALNLPKNFIKQNLKTNPISETELEELYHFSKSYEVLINKRSRLYNERNLKNKNKSEGRNNLFFMLIINLFLKFVCGSMYNHYIKIY